MIHRYPLDNAYRALWIDFIKSFLEFNLSHKKIFFNQITSEIFYSYNLTITNFSDL
jgi:hypothetical protein